MADLPLGSSSARKHPMISPVRPTAATERHTQSKQQVHGARDLKGDAHVGDFEAQILVLRSQQVTVLGQLARFRQIDEAVDAGLP